MSNSRDRWVGGFQVFFNHGILLFLLLHYICPVSPLNNTIGQGEVLLVGTEWRGHVISGLGLPLHSRRHHHRIFRGFQT